MYSIYCLYLPVVPVEGDSDGLYYHHDYASYVYSPSCHDQHTMTTIQDVYIQRLKTTPGFASFCSTFNNECISENVDVKCYT